MDWNAVGAVGELVGAIAVVISLVYLASQVRSGSRALQTTMRDSSFHALTVFNYQLIADPDLAWEFQQGCRDTELLDEKQRARFLHTAYSFFKLFENMYLHYLEGAIGPEAWDHNRQVLVAYGSQPGARSYIEARLPIFDPRFREVLEDLGPTEITPGGEAFLDASVRPGAS